MKNKKNKKSEAKIGSQDESEALREPEGLAGNRSINIINVTTYDNRKTYSLHLGGKGFAFIVFVIEVFLLVIREQEFYKWVLDNFEFLDTLIFIIIYALGFYLIFWIILLCINKLGSKTESVTRRSDTYMRDNININQNFYNHDLSERK